MWTDNTELNFVVKHLSKKELATVNYLLDLQKLSKCKKDKVAAILVSEDFTQMYSIGINGGPIEQENCLCEKVSKFGCAHAEQNCLVKNKNFDKPKIMICTSSPCPTCAALIVNAKANIKQFWFIDQYKDDTGLSILFKANIECFMLSL